MESLLSRGADANLAAEGGVTALHAAAEMGSLELVKALIQVCSSSSFCSLRVAFL